MASTIGRSVSLKTSCCVSSNFKGLILQPGPERRDVGGRPVSPQRKRPAIRNPDEAQQAAPREGMRIGRLIGGDGGRGEIGPALRPPQQLGGEQLVVGAALVAGEAGGAIEPLRPGRLGEKHAGDHGLQEERLQRGGDLNLLRASFGQQVLFCDRVPVDQGERLTGRRGGAPMKRPHDGQGDHKGQHGQDAAE